VYSVFVRRVDAYSGNMFYYNVQTRLSSWTKPLLLGEDDLRPPEWVVRCDADGQWYYENRVSPWLSSTERPRSFLPCLVCNLQLSFIRCDTCSQHFCLDCFEEAHPLKNRQTAAHEWGRKPYENVVKAVPEMCFMCNTEPAVKLCLECSLVDFYCQRCYELSHHRNPRRPNRVTPKMQHGAPIEF